jgi:hypothetical protein
LPTPTSTNVTSSADVGPTASAIDATARLASDNGTLAWSDSRWSRGAPANIVTIAATDRREYRRPRRLSESEW